MQWRDEWGLCRVELLWILIKHFCHILSHCGDRRTSAENCSFISFRVSSQLLVVLSELSSKKTTTLEYEVLMCNVQWDRSSYDYSVGASINFSCAWWEHLMLSVFMTKLKSIYNMHFVRLVFSQFQVIKTIMRSLFRG